MKIKTTLLILLISIAVCLQAQGNEGLENYSGDNNSTEFKTGELMAFDFNTSGKTEAYPSLTSDGKGLYYTNNQTKNWIFYTHRDASSGKWQVPVPIVIENFDTCILSCTYVDERKTMYFTTGRGVYSCQSVDGSFSKFGKVQKIEIIHGAETSDMNPFSYLSFSSDMTVMYAYLGNSQEVSMASYTLVGEHTYKFNEVVTTTNKEMGCISKNGLVYYFTNDETRNTLFCKKRNTRDEAFGPTIYTVKEFRNNVDIGQISMAEKAGVMVVVVSNDNWDNNDLYLVDIDIPDSYKIRGPGCSFTLADITVPAATAVPVTPPVEEIYQAIDEISKKPIATSTEINAGTGANIYKVEIGTAYPNPARNLFYFYYSVDGDKDKNKQATVVIMDNTGREVYSRKLDNLRGEARIELEDVAAGTYFIRIDYNGASSAMSKVVIMNN